MSDLAKLQQQRANTIDKLSTLIRNDSRFQESTVNRVQLQTQTFRPPDRRQEFRDIQLDKQFQNNYDYLAYNRTINPNHLQTTSPTYG